MLNQYKDNDNLYLDQYSILFYNIPKVASSSIWSLCAEIEKGHKVVRRDQIRGFKIPSIKSSDLSEFPDVTKIAFVRNPFDRVVSCYINKIANKHNKFIQRNGLSENMSFESFVDHICQLKDCDSDRHFRSQYTYIFDHQANLLADYVGRIETFSEDFNEVINLYQLPKLEIPNWNNTKHKPYAAYFNPLLVDKIQERYKIDLMLFGYEFDKPLDVNKKDDWKKELSSALQSEILKYKCQKLLRLVKHKEKYDDLPKGVKGLIVRKYKEYFTNYFD